MLLLAENLTKSFGERVLFQNINLQIDEGQKVALVAKNGEGKSTLLKILAGKETSDTGKVIMNKDYRLAYLPQEPELIAGKTIIESLLDSGGNLVTAIKEYELALDNLSFSDSTQNQTKLEEATAKMDLLNAWDFEQKISTVLTNLNIHHLDQQVQTLSGGQRKRVALAKIILDEPDLVLLDEPTNHLDLDMIEWLENYLKRQRTALLLVTHDRYFLDRLTSEIIELDNQKVTNYKGNYATYLEKKAEAQALSQLETEKARNLMRKELEWMRRQPKARTTKSKSRISAFYDLKEKSTGPQQGAGIELEMKMSRLGGKIIEVHKINKRFDSKVILDDFGYIFEKKDRIGIVGPNGVGKTTFLEVLTGAVKPDSGTIETGETVVFGYYKQEGLKLPEDLRAIEVVKDIAENIPVGNGESISAGTMMQRFGFEPARQFTKVSSLSGGEKRRLYLLTLLVKNPNFLILDEPTNDLDLPTLNILEDFLLGFGGCLLIVSHDRFFLDKLCTHLFIFEGQGVIKNFNGTYSEYREIINEENKVSKVSAKNYTPLPVAPQATEQKTKRKASFKEKKELEEVEKLMSQQENRLKELESNLSSGTGSAEDFSNWGKELSSLKTEYDKNSDRWLELSELD